MENRKSKVGTSPSAPVALSADEYDPDGHPVDEISLTWRTYDLGGGQRSIWVAQYSDLPGYFGEGSTVDEALKNLWNDLGPRPHYRVGRQQWSVDRKTAFIDRHGKAMAGAALTRADAWGINLGGGAAVEATAKSFGIGKPALDAARARLADAIRPATDGTPTFGLSAEALREVARASLERIELDQLVAVQTPWRFDHAEARKQFPVKIGQSLRGSAIREK